MNKERGYDVPELDKQDLVIRSNISYSNLEQIYVLDNNLQGAEYREWQNIVEELFKPLFSGFVVPPEAPEIIAENPYYIGGDLIGKQGVEQSYETYLRGQKGVKYILKDKFNREIGSYKEGLTRQEVQVIERCTKNMCDCWLQRRISKCLVLRVGNVFYWLKLCKAWLVGITIVEETKGLVSCKVIGKVRRGQEI
jgi:hypothetical protein